MLFFKINGVITVKQRLIHLILYPKETMFENEHN